jgi:hypothetical protein
MEKNSDPGYGINIQDAQHCLPPLCFPRSRCAARRPACTLSRRSSTWCDACSPPPTQRRGTATSSSSLPGTSSGTSGMSSHEKPHPNYSLITSVGDPTPQDPYVFGPPGSGFGSFNHQAKIGSKTLIPTVLWLLSDVLSFKNDVNVPSKRKKQKNWEKKN